MTPIEKTFATEYPGFDPFPFGQASWLMTPGRGIVLAEPMVEDFGRCFAGITDEETVLALADSYRLVPAGQLRDPGPLAGAARRRSPRPAMADRRTEHQLGTQSLITCPGW